MIVMNFVQWINSKLPEGAGESTKSGRFWNNVGTCKKKNNKHMGSLSYLYSAYLDGELQLVRVQNS